MLPDAIMESIQINIRISKDLAQEIDSVAEILKITRGDWIRSTLAQEALDAHKQLLQEVRELERMMDSDVGKILKKMRYQR